MKRVGLILAAAALLAPGAAEAQRPSNNMHTRSADVYLKQAADTRVHSDRQELFEKALQAALAGISQDANNSRSWYQAGVAYAGLDDFVGADSTFARAESLHPPYAEEIDPIRLNAWIAAYNTGVQALQQGDFAAAKHALEQADRLYAKRPEALVTLGSLYAEDGDLARAEQTYVKVLGILRGPERAKQNERDRQNWADDELNVSFRLANLLNEQNRADDAEKVLRDLLASQPDNVIARAQLAAMLSRAGRNDESAAMFTELLQRDDLGEATLFNIGVGLFRAEKFAESAGAFRRAVEANPQNHDVLYNLAQALLGRTGQLENERASATAARQEQIKNEVLQISEEMLVTTERINAIDPANRNVLMLMAQAHRTIGEARGGSAVEASNRQVLAILEKHKALPFEVSDIVMAHGESTVEVNGRVTNLTRTEGTPLRFRFSIISVDGTELASEDVSVDAPVTEESRRFSLRLDVPEGAAGWKYQLIP
jgi:tetratricopeptide (TPR) repeat protein